MNTNSSPKTSITEQIEKALQRIKAIEEDHPLEAKYLYFRLLDIQYKLFRHEIERYII